MIKVKNPKTMGNYSGYGRGGPATKKEKPGFKGSAGKGDFGSGSNVVTTKKYC